MKRGALAAVVASVLVLLLAPSAAASHDPSGEPFGVDFVSGTAAQPVQCLGTLCFQQRFTFSDVRSGASGENPTGTVEVTIDFGPRGSASFSGPVSCLNVTGNRATVGVDFSAGPAPGSFTGAVFFLQDSDGAGQDGLALTLDGGVPSVCPGVPAAAPPPIAEGDITVHDSPPLPTSKEQCKRGGWRNFGTAFKNEGQCVAFVQRRPKP
jgi:hypothetical protein